MRVVASSHADPFSAMSAASSALYGPLHGGANEAAINMLTEIGSLENVESFIKSVDYKASVIASTRTTTREQQSSKKLLTTSSM
jgi:citrate synthase